MLYFTEKEKKLWQINSRKEEKRAACITLRQGEYTVGWNGWRMTQPEDDPAGGRPSRRMTRPEDDQAGGLYTNSDSKTNEWA